MIQEEHKNWIVQASLAGKSDLEIASTLHLSLTLVATYRRKAGILRDLRRPAIHHDIQASIARLAAAGKSDLEVAEALHVSTCIAGRYRRKAGILHERGRPRIALNIRKSITQLVAAGKSDIEAAMELNISKSTVGNCRRAAGIKYTRGAKSTGSPAFDKVDWQLSDTQISHKIGLSRERVRQVRRAGNFPDALNKRQHTFSESYIISQYIKDNIDAEWIKQHTLKELQSKCQICFPEYNYKAALKSLGVKCKRPEKSRLVPYELIDWRLTNIQIFKIWGSLKSPTCFAAYRCRFLKGSALPTSENKDTIATIVAIQQKLADNWRASKKH